MKFPSILLQTCIETSQGPVWLAASPQGLAGLWFAGQKHLPAQLTIGPSWQHADAHPVLQLAARQFNEYLAGQRQVFDVPLDLSSGSAFQQSVWQALLDLPFGTTTSYGALSERLGTPSAVRAVAAAVGRNPVSVLVPCHRVLGARGDLTGYAGGLERKAALLGLEGTLPVSKADLPRSAPLFTEPFV
jgi:methylated-DNA-[protein]-cysteine S-methyltransferase